MPWFLPEWVWPGPLPLVFSLLLALLLDTLYPYHRGVLLRLHPVHTGFLLARRIGRPCSSRLRGVIAWVTVVFSHLAVASTLLYAAHKVSPLLWGVVAAIIAKHSFSLRLLLEIGVNAYRAYRAGDMDRYRWWAQQLVRRNVRALGERHVASAVVESLAESLVDGYTSPLTYYALLGPLGALFQRMANTMDSALGYRENCYRDVGWASARIDDIVNFLPARLTAIIIILAAALAGQHVNRETILVWLRYRSSLVSVNAGHPISAIAASLYVRLEKPGHYSVNTEAPLPRAEKIPAAVRVVLVAAILYTTIIIAIILALDAYIFHINL